MKHISYDSIENHYNSKVISRAKELIASGATCAKFVVQEKLHGANFSIYWTPNSPNELKYGSRNQFVTENFYSFKRAIDNIGEENILKFFNSFHSNRVAYPTPTEDTQLYILYGELIGGNYHKDVPKIQGVKAVQKEVYYGNDNRLVFFDLKYNLDAANNYMAYEDIGILNKWLQLFNIPNLPILFEGTLDECISQTEDFNSTHYKSYHPELELSANPAEGIVIKSLWHDIVNAPERLIFKKKSKNFLENKGEDVSPKSPEPLPEEVNALLEKIIPYINSNRVNSLFSKQTNFEMSMIPSLAGELLQDALVDYEKEHGNEDFEKDLFKRVKTILYKTSIALVKPELVNRLSVTAQ
jgi:Rnl2 family RNA ligase